MDRFKPNLLSIVVESEAHLVSLLQLAGESMSAMARRKEFGDQPAFFNLSSSVMLRMFISNQNRSVHDR